MAKKEATPKFLKEISVFTKEECEEFINKAEKIGWTTINAKLALYNRSIMIDPDLAEKLRWIIDLIPEPYRSNAVCINDHFRFSKYHPGGEFLIHRDGFNIDKDKNISLFTINIFLNDDFEGGSTVFYHENLSERHVVKPRIGVGSVFHSQQFHSGEKVTKGYKYLIRTDIMMKP